jgi:3-methyladenine DNA glycosylase AlkD
MTEWGERYCAAVVDALEPLADPERAGQMAAYMKDQFPFFGVTAAPRRAAVRAAVRDLGRPPSGDDVLDCARRLWRLDERELQYVGSDLLAHHPKLLRTDHLAGVRQLIESKSWWDTVDALASPTVGALVLADPALGAVMDEWIDDPNIWVARTAIIHQLRFKEATDAERLFEFCLRRAGDTEFFIRKAIGWALRQYAKVAPLDVREFVSAHEDELSRLSVREATKHL